MIAFDNADTFEAWKDNDEYKWPIAACGDFLWKHFGCGVYNDCHARVKRTLTRDGCAIMEKSGSHFQEVSMLKRRIDGATKGKIKASIASGSRPTMIAIDFYAEGTDPIKFKKRRVQVANYKYREQQKTNDALGMKLSQIFALLLRKSRYSLFYCGKADIRSFIAEKIVTTRQ
jgi:hypothetical protein